MCPKNVGKFKGSASNHCCHQKLLRVAAFAASHLILTKRDLFLAAPDFSHQHVE